MCGRYTFTQPVAAMRDMFNITLSPDAPKRYNIAPGQMTLVVRERIVGAKRVREPAEVKWGLVPSWSKDASIGSKLINARGETLDEKPSFRYAFKNRRCVIPADGFYEWQTVSKMKVPFYIHLKNHRTFAFAGLWENWERNEGFLQTCSVVTTSANEMLKPLHERMPVILENRDIDEWLDHRTSPERLKSLIRSFPEDDMTLYPVRDFVSEVKYEGPALIEPRPEIQPEEIADSQMSLF